MKFILTIDTEADNQWQHGAELTVKNIKYIPRFQKLFDKYCIRPTYLVTSEVCDDSYAKELFTEYINLGKAEIGAHLHSWTTPPFIDLEGLRYNDKNHAFASELPYGLLYEKIKTLSSQIETSFGTRPCSFRSGRYGYNENVAKALLSNSYLVDSSVTPFINWISHQGIPTKDGGPDFLDSTPFPYRYYHENRSLIELPITIIPTRFPFNKNHGLARSYFRKVDNSLTLRFFRKLFYKRQPMWMRPFEWMNDFQFKEILDEAINLRLPYVVMMFHSSELMPGGSKYWTDERSIDKLYNLLENFFILLQDIKIVSCTLKEAVI